MIHRIGLYDVRAIHPDKHFVQRSRTLPNGKRRTFMHRLLVSAYSHEAARDLALSHLRKKTGKEFVDALSLQIDGLVEDLGSYAIPNEIVARLRMKSDYQFQQQAKQMEDDDA